MKALRDLWLTQSNGRTSKLYVIRCWNDEEEFYKIGITFKTVKRRFAGQKIMPYSFEIIYLYESDEHKEVQDLELKLLDCTKHCGYQPKIKFKGSTECRVSINSLFTL